ncbi:MAG: hypothetical protein QNL33_09495 [Akkermansiaceae bacterium]
MNSSHLCSPGDPLTRGSRLPLVTQLRRFLALDRVGERNEDRYETNISHGRGYDSKNLMHTLRLLEQATDIAREGRIILPRPNAEWLKAVKAGDYDYEDLLKIAEEKNAEMVASFEASPLMDQPSHEVAEESYWRCGSVFRS